MHMLRRDKKEEEDEMPPKRKCSCKNHEYCLTLFPNDVEGHAIYRIKDRKASRKVIDFLLKRELLFPHSTFLCILCVKYAEQSLKHESDQAEPAEKKSFSIVDYFDEFLHAITDNKLTLEQLTSLAYALGKTQSRVVYDDIQTISSQYKDIEYLQTFNIKDWLSERNSVVIGFVKGVSADAEIDTSLAKTVEAVYGCRNSKFVAPLSFSQTLLNYYVSGSKSVVQMASKGTPSGCYSTVTKWIADQTTEKVNCPRNADVVTFFDNNQVLEKKWKVEVNYKSSTSVITTVVHIIPDEKKQIQRLPELSPKTWLDMSESGKERTVEKMKLLDNIHFEEFRKFRNEFVEAKIKEVCSSGRDITGEGGTNVPYVTANERYNFVRSGHSTTPTVLMGEPCFENPCSYESVEKVLDHILDITEVGHHRDWTMIGCDGLPYTLASRIIDNTFRCPECTREFLDLPDYQQHRKDYDHATNCSTNECRKYNNIMMIPGLGHYEINMTKAIFRLLWDIVLVDLAKLLGFQSPKAQASCMNATDHHKSWQIFQIFFHAMAAELILVYVKDQNTVSPPSADGFYSWFSGVSNPNYKFMADAVFTYCLALHVFRAGVRRNNSVAINSAKTKFSPIFFGLNMPFYMETYIRDSFLRIQCPDEVRKFIEENESYSVSGNESKGEGGDFVLEAKNRKTKMWIQNGVPDNNKWLNVCRCIDKLEKVRQNVTTALDITDIDQDYAYMYNISYEISSFRDKIRKSNYLDDPTTEKQHTTFSGKRLDDSVKTLNDTCITNREKFVEFTIDHNLKERMKFIPIFILPQDREKYYSIENQTKSEICNKIQNYVDELSDSKFTARWMNLKNKSKAVLLDFLKEVKELVDCDI